MIVGTYHFVSKAGLHDMSVDDPMSVVRQQQIQDVV